MAYVPFHADWRDKPDATTPVTAAALEHIETGIVDAAADADAAVKSTVIRFAEPITQAAYDALPTPDPNTQYLIIAGS